MLMLRLRCLAVVATVVPLAVLLGTAFAAHQVVPLLTTRVSLSIIFSSLLLLRAASLPSAVLASGPGEQGHFCQYPPLLSKNIVRSTTQVHFI
jgi:hypothetical protein